ncbi:hypothetical protein B0H19DRAFT_1245644 [Mycena capillaripes]|nr:hypothetical protein B0H19DRAFT_1245644 [Mycena capillaripes]
MCPSTQQTHCAAGAPVAFGHCAPYVLPAPHAPAVVPGWQTARAFPALAAGKGPFTDYPPQHATHADEALVHTYASFREAVALPANTRGDDSWTLCIPVPVPKMRNPTLLAVDYLIQYATTADYGNATVQTDVVLTAAALPMGVVSAGTGLAVYRPSMGTPRMVDQDSALPLANTLAVKCNTGGEQWSHYVDTQHVASNVRIREAAQLYVVFNVEERSTFRTARSLSVEVSATWQKEEVELKVLAEEERKAKEAAEKEAKEAAEKKAKEADEQKARDEARAWMEGERRARQEEERERSVAKAAREEEKQARKEAQEWRQEERVHWVEEREAREANAAAMAAAIAEVANLSVNVHQSIDAAPAIADQKTQKSIEKTMERLGLEACPSGFPFVKREDGYRCNGGTVGGTGKHFISFKDLGLK